MSSAYTKFRLYLFQFIAIAAFFLVAAKLWQLQIVSSQDFQQRADRNRFRLVPVDAPRGIVYDRAGRLLVRNVPSFVVSVIPSALPAEGSEERGAVVRRLSELLDVPATAEAASADGSVTSEAGDEALAEMEPPKTIEQMIAERITGEHAVSPHQPVRIATNVERDVAFVLEEERLHLPGVVVEAQPVRQYLDGPLMAHILGYMGRIPEERAEQYLEDTTYLYQPDDMVGLAGIEATQESLLRGQKGQKHVEVDAYEREVAVISQQEAVQGYNLKLTIDLELQRVTEQALWEWMQKAGSEVGVAIAMDPRDGAVLAMVTLPNFDNNLFSGGISFEDYERLSSDKRRPLVNHAVSGQYPPGSTFKLVPATGALEEGVITEATRLNCSGVLYLPNRFAPNDASLAQPFYCWRSGGHGSLNVVGGIANSCNIFFYQLTGGYGSFEGLGIKALGEWALRYGYGAETGIDLTGEVPGLIPSDKWKRHTYGESWTTGDTYNAAIGQGFVLATPLQVLNTTATIANRGTVVRPQLVYQVMDGDGNVVRQLEPDPIRELGASEHTLNLVRRGMLEAVERGTAPLARVPGIAVAGKTGTAEYAEFDEAGKLITDSKGNLPKHAWYTGFAPFDDPEIAVVVFLYGGDEGSRVSAPVSARIMRHYFGVPEPGATPTPSEPTSVPTPEG
jgi:penicillin-binding protein 2